MYLALHADFDLIRQVAERNRFGGPPKLSPAIRQMASHFLNKKTVNRSAPALHA
jgi:hypothetical protein